VPTTLEWLGAVVDQCLGVDLVASVRNGRRARLIVADHQRIVRSGLKSLLVNEEQFEIVGEAGSGREALELCSQLHPDLVLMDIHLPDMDGLVATQEIKQRFSDISVLILTTQEDEDYVMLAVKSGASGYLLKDASENQLIDAIRKVLDGELILDHKLAIRVISWLADQLQDFPQTEQPRNLVQPLTRRELEVLKLMALGYRNCAIAEKLTITLGTTKNHVEHIRTKLGVSDRTQAVVRALELGLVKVPSASIKMRDLQYATRNA
jgi:DNA-binding NarL/FixJ family response regulator